MIFDKGRVGNRHGGLVKKLFDTGEEPSLILSVRVCVYGKGVYVHTNTLTYTCILCINIFTHSHMSLTLILTVLL